MDLDAISAITHGDRPFHNPLAVACIDEAIDRLDLGPRDRGLDTARVSMILAVLDKRAQAPIGSSVNV